MRVLHVLNTGKFSGAENVVCQIINMFKNDTSCDMAYCSFDGPVREAIEKRDILFCPISKMSVKELKRVISDYNPDIIHAHDMKAGYITAKACGSIPFVSHIHNNAFNSRGLSVKSIAYYFAARKAKKIIWVSQSSFNGYVLHKAFERKSVILYNVIDQNDLQKRVEQDETSYDYDVSYVGRITYQKNPHRLLEILRIVCDELPELKVAIVGTGDDDEEIKQLSHDLNLDNNVDFLGFKSNPLKVLYDSKVMVMTSRWEGTPMVALEAMALGVPIISTPTDGMNELIKDGINGYLVDENKDFSKRVIELVTDENKRNEMKNHQIELSKKVNDIEKYKSVLREIYGL